MPQSKRITRTHTKYLVALVAAQGVCLALGLWLEYRLIDLTIRAKPRSAIAASSVTADNGMNAPREGNRASEATGGLMSDAQTLRDAAARREGPPPASAAREPASGQRLSAWSEIQAPMTAIRMMVFIWIAALQAGVAFLVLSRLQQASSHQAAAAGVSLQSYHDLMRTRDAMIFGLAKLAESRDPDTGNHLERIAVYSTMLASELRRNSRYRNQISPEFVRLIGVSSSLHDIGKVGIADSILMKPGRFEEEERLVMQLHVAIGGQCVKEIEKKLGASNFLQMAREIAFCHHERWDGRGYPEGLAGEEIPLAARIVAVADVYDALCTPRVYKKAIPHRQCVEMIRIEAGGHFDPAVVEAFLAVEAEIQKTSMQFNESADDSADAAPAAETAAADARRAIDDDIADVLRLLDQLATDAAECVRNRSGRDGAIDPVTQLWRDHALKDFAANRPGDQSDSSHLKTEDPAHAN